jgi:hypothetical protein
MKSNGLFEKIYVTFLILALIGVAGYLITTSVFPNYNVTGYRAEVKWQAIIADNDFEKAAITYERRFQEFLPREGDEDNHDNARWTPRPDEPAKGEMTYSEFLAYMSSWTNGAEVTYSQRFSVSYVRLHTEFTTDDEITMIHNTLIAVRDGKIISIEVITHTVEDKFYATTNLANPNNIRPTQTSLSVTKFIFSW